jgi:hypothetical protein
MKKGNLLILTYTLVVLASVTSVKLVRTYANLLVPGSGRADCGDCGDPTPPPTPGG